MHGRRDETRRVRLCMRGAFVLHVNSVAAMVKSRKHRRRQSKMEESHSHTVTQSDSWRSEKDESAAALTNLELAEGPVIVCARHIYNGTGSNVALHLPLLYRVCMYAFVVAARALRRCKHKRQALLCFCGRIGDASSGGA